MIITPQQLKSLLVASGVLSAEQFDKAEKEAVYKNISLEKYLPEGGYIPDATMGQTIAKFIRMPFMDLAREDIKNEDIYLIPEIVAKTQKAIVFAQDEKSVSLGTSNPNAFEFIKLLERRSGKSVIVYYSTPVGVQSAFRYYKSDIAAQADLIIKDLRLHPQNEEDVVKLVNLILEYAHDNRASDIHIEPLENNVLVRFRIDGMLHEVINYPKSLHPKIISRFKIMSRLRTDETAAAQDGRFDYSTEYAKFDVRVSVVPVTNGENVVLRLLSELSRRLSLEELGFSDNDRGKVERAITKPYGMILTAGPTGSGKTTTLYAVLQMLKQPDVNIMTIEDPVEYAIDRIQQIQVNFKKGLTFANGLRSIVRQDPDIIMVGEVRDDETASISINAAMTGHLLLSTLHTNDAATTFPRLMDLGVEPFLVASSVNVIIAQRLVRKICNKCRVTYPLTMEEAELLEREPKLVSLIKEIGHYEDLSAVRLYKGAGCEACGMVGYIGRMGIFEVMEVGDDLRLLITQKASAGDIDMKAKVQKAAIRPLFYSFPFYAFASFASVLMHWVHAVTRLSRSRMG